MDVVEQIPNIYYQDILLCMTNEFIIIVILSIIISILGYYILRDYRVPPGPVGVPILGYWPFMKKEDCHLQMLELKKRYGDVFSFRVTGKLYINLSSLDTLKEALVNKSNCFAEKSMEYCLKGVVFKNNMTFSNKEKWLCIRKYFLNHLKDRGMISYRENTAEAMNDNINTLMEELRRNVGKPLDVYRIMMAKSNHLIRQTLLGPNTPVTEEEIQEFIDHHRTVAMIMSPTNLFPIGMLAKYFIFSYEAGFKKGLKALEEVKKFLQRIVDDHKKSFNEENMRDVIDCYIHERNVRKTKDDPTAEYFTDETLVSTIQQFVGDAVLTGALFITHIIKILLDHPEEQEKIYKEIQEVCGDDRNPSFEDKNKLVYTTAFLQEASRTAQLMRFFPSLECCRETTIKGYRIPKGSIAVLNIYCAHYDPHTYKNPEKFDPTRFLDKENEKKADSPITFGIGKRVCIGENFIMMQTFLYCIAIIKHFKMAYAKPTSFHELKKSRVLEVILTPRKQTAETT